MKPLGIELRGYACFDRQYIALKPGINLLVGRNNSGKTSVLRALTLLRNALKEHQASAEMDVRPYARLLQPEAHFDISVFFEFEKGDQPPFDRSDRFNWAELVERQRPVAAINMRLWSNNILGLLGAEMRLQGASYALLEISQGGISSLAYAPPIAPDGGVGGVANHLRRVVVARSQTQQPDGQQAYSGIDSPLIQALDQLRKIRTVNPHRVAADRLPLSTSMAMATNANDLGPYLQTLLNNRRRRFEQIEDFVTASFPEFERVDPASEGNQVTLKVVRKGAEEGLPLAYCGTGVEQILALAAVITESQPGEIILMDEPHSFLHPAAERALLEFLSKFPDRYFVIATHSAVFINAVVPDRITHLQPPGTPYESSTQGLAVSGILHELGYRNSDALFFDQLVVVEGPSDTEILPLLLRLDSRTDVRTLANVGFLSIDGINESAREIQTKILRFEKLLSALGRARMPRQYLLDGDRTPEDVNLLAGTRNPTTDEPIRIQFLPRAEIENYLLLPEAIAIALSEEAKLAGVCTKPDHLEVKAKLESLLATGDERLFPNGKGAAPLEKVKGSRLLEQLYAQFENLRYDKNRSGQVIARNIRPNTAPGLSELVEQLGIVK